MRRAWGAAQRARVTARDVGGGVVHLRMRTLGSRMLGMDVSAYLVGDVLVDTGFAYVRGPLVRALRGRTVRAICCTHNHEDHTGNAAVLAAVFDCPVYLRHAERLWQEGVRKLAPYRRIWWGPVDEFVPVEMPDAIESGGRALEVVAAAGHSESQVAFHDADTGDVFTGDLFVSPGASAVMIWGDPWQEVASLRRVAALGPRRMLTGHGRIVVDPVPALELRAERIEKAARQAVRLAAEGAPPRQIVRQVFPRGRFKDRFFERLTSREFSRLNFVNAAVRLEPDRGPAPAG